MSAHLVAGSAPARLRSEPKVVEPVLLRLLRLVAVWMERSRQRRALADLADVTTFSPTWAPRRRGLARKPQSHFGFSRVRATSTPAATKPLRLTIVTVIDSAQNALHLRPARAISPHHRYIF